MHGLPTVENSVLPTVTSSFTCCLTNVCVEHLVREEAQLTERGAGFENLPSCNGGRGTRTFQSKPHPNLLQVTTGRRSWVATHMLDQHTCGSFPFWHGTSRIQSECLKRCNGKSRTGVYRCRCARKMPKQVLSTLGRWQCKSKEGCRVNVWTHR